MSEGRRKQFRVQKDSSALNALNRVLLVLVIVAGVIGGVAAILPQLARLSELRETNQRLSAEVAEREQQLERNRREIQLLENNAEYVELIARDKLDMMKDGETVFRIATAKNE